MTITDILSLSHVPRWAIVDHIKPQSVADHSFRVAHIAMELAVRLNLTFTPTAVIWALVHDIAECRTGDIPASFKDFTQPDVLRFGKFSTPTQGELEIIKLADWIEAVTFIDRYGVGVHAAKIAQSIHAKILAEAGRYSLEDREAIARLISDITNDEERYEGPAPGHRVGQDASR